MINHVEEVASKLRDNVIAIRNALKAQGSSIKLSNSAVVHDVETRGGYIQIGTVNSVPLHLWIDQSLRGDKYDFWVGLCSSDERGINDFVSKVPETFAPVTTLVLADYSEEWFGWKISRRLTDGQLSRPIRETSSDKPPVHYLGLYLPIFDPIDAASLISFWLEGRISNITFLEGACEQITTNRYERDPAARAACLTVNGYTCKVCTTDLVKVYGSLAERFIHVHHLEPLSRAEVRHTTVEGLIPVCPNCHAMLHRSGLKSPDELRNLMAVARSGGAGSA